MARNSISFCLYRRASACIPDSSALVEAAAAAPAGLEVRGILLAAFAARAGRAGGHGFEEGFDHLARAGRIAVALHPNLRQRGLDGQLAREARGIGVEYPRGDQLLLQPIDDELRLGEVGGGVDALQVRTCTP